MAKIIQFPVRANTIYALSLLDGFIGKLENGVTFKISEHDGDFYEPPSIDLEWLSNTHLLPENADDLEVLEELILDKVLEGEYITTNQAKEEIDAYNRYEDELMKKQEEIKFMDSPREMWELKDDEWELK